MADSTSNEASPEEVVFHLGEIIGHLIWILDTIYAPGWQGNCEVCAEAMSFLQGPAKHPS